MRNIDRTKYPELSVKVIESLKPWLSNEEYKMALSGPEYGEYYQGARHAMYIAIIERDATLPADIIDEIKRSKWGNTSETLGESDFLSKVLQKARERELVPA